MFRFETNKSLPPFLYTKNQILEIEFEDKIVPFYSSNIYRIGNTCVFSRQSPPETGSFVDIAIRVR